MNSSSAFSMDDLDALCQSPAPAPELPFQASAGDAQRMNRSFSEWAFERLIQEASGSPVSEASVVGGANGDFSGRSRASSSRLEEGDEDVVEIKKPPPPSHPSPSAASIDSDDYQAYLRSRLFLDCAVVAKRRSPTGKPLNSTSLAENNSLASIHSKLGSQALGPGDGMSMEQSKVSSESLGMHTLPTLEKKSGVHVAITTSESSKEQSDDDDDLEGDTETTENTNPSDDKRARRMLSNRESARRSRRRKQEHLNELETQVSQLKVENSSLSKCLTDVSQKYQDAAVDNRVLKANIETLRAKVEMAGAAVQRAAGFNPLLRPIPDRPSIGEPFVNRQSNVPIKVPVQAQLDTNSFFHQPVPNTTSAPHSQRLNNVFPINSPAAPADNVHNDGTGNKKGQTSPLQPVASLEHVQKQICIGTDHCGASNALLNGN
ncbi:light-inducible protein CPRF2-like [Malania oleifera]|uniref:light-inducible protein CPRF2-like n=1 Tax=Malania oleifera TaxID=397392 RepID=UPI0025ADD930|nr:light-inducible protein CPRF2-like [Malania oleifera]